MQVVVGNRKLGVVEDRCGSGFGCARFRFVREWRYGGFRKEQSAGVCGLRGGQLFLGMRILLRQDCAGGDELCAYGAVPLFVCDAGAVAAAGDASAGVEWREWGLLAVASFLGVPVQFLIQFYALSITTVSHAALMVGTMPVILAVGAAVFAHERMDRVGWMALAGSTCGAALIALGGGEQCGSGATLAGDLLVVVSLLIALFWILINKQLMERHSHVVVTAYGLGIGTLMLMVWVPVRYGMPPVAGVSLKAWLALAGEWGAVHGDDDAAVELGDDAGSGFAGGSAAEYGAADRESAGGAGAGGAAGAECVGWRWVDSGFGGDVDDAVEDASAGADAVDVGVRLNQCLES